MGTLLSEDEMFDETKEMAVGDLFLILGGGKPPSDSRFSSDGGDNISIKIALTRELMEELIHLEACNDVWLVSSVLLSRMLIVSVYR